MWVIGAFFATLYQIGELNRDFDVGLVRGLLWPVILVRAVVMELFGILYRG